MFPVFFAAATKPQQFAGAGNPQAKWRPQDRLVPSDTRMSTLSRFVFLLLAATALLYSCSAIALAWQMPEAFPTRPSAPVRPLLGLWSGSGPILILGAAPARDQPREFMAR
jgi:hypothetical protein